MEKKNYLCLWQKIRHRLFFCLSLAFSQNFCFGENLFNFLEYKLSANFTLPQGDSDKEKTVAGNTGLKASFRDADLRGYVTLPKTKFSEIEDANSASEKFELLDDFRYGAGIFLFKKSLPLTLKIGQNSFSKSVSKMRNPSPSTTANPLTKSFAFSTGIGASLPTLSSSVQPLSFAATFSVPKDKFALL